MQVAGEFVAFTTQRGKKFVSRLAHCCFASYIQRADTPIVAKREKQMTLGGVWNLLVLVI